MNGGGFGRPGGLENHSREQFAETANRDFSEIENNTENRAVANHSLPSQKENAAAAVLRNGAIIPDEVNPLPAQNIASIEASHPIISLHWGALA